MRVLAMASQKGGSGKTTLSGHLAVQAQRAGAGPVVLIDIDPQGSLSDWWNERQTEYPAFAQTTVARLAADLEALRVQGFKLAVIDTPPAITMAIQSVIQVAELVVIPTRPSPHDLRAVGATVDLCDRAGKSAIFVVNAATPKARITRRRRSRAVAARHRRADHDPPAHRFRRVDDRRPHRHGGRSEGQVRRRGHRVVGVYRGPAGEEFPPYRLQRAQRARRVRRASGGRRFRPPGGRLMPASSTGGLASLTSGLLARKGQARPAMRPQGFAGFPVAPAPLDDLGWNDMGATEAPSDAEIVARHLTDDPAIDFPEIPRPAVLVEREALAEQIAAPPAAIQPVSVATATRLRRETAHVGKAAFTLRLDSGRHLRLRLASAITNLSSQTLVAQALDHLLSTLPEVETLVAQLPPAKARTK